MNRERLENGSRLLTMEGLREGQHWAGILPEGLIRVTWPDPLHAIIDDVTAIEGPRPTLPAEADDLDRVSDAQLAVTAAEIGVKYRTGDSREVLIRKIREKRATAASPAKA